MAGVLNELVPGGAALPFFDPQHLSGAERVEQGRVHRALLCRRVASALQSGAAHSRRAFPPDA